MKPVVEPVEVGGVERLPRARSRPARRREARTDSTTRRPAPRPRDSIPRPAGARPGSGCSSPRWRPWRWWRPSAGRLPGGPVRGGDHGAEIPPLRSRIAGCVLAAGTIGQIICTGPWGLICAFGLVSCRDMRCRGGLHCGGGLRSGRPCGRGMRGSWPMRSWTLLFPLCSLGWDSNRGRNAAKDAFSRRAFRRRGPGSMAWEGAGDRMARRRNGASRRGVSCQASGSSVPSRKALRRRLDGGRRNASSRAVARPRRTKKGAPPVIRRSARMRQEVDQP